MARRRTAVRPPRRPPALLHPLSVIMQSALICSRAATDQRGLHDHAEKVGGGRREGEGGGGGGCAVAGVLLFFGFRGSRRGLSLAIGSSFGIGSAGTAKADQNIVGLLGRAPAATGRHQVCR